MLKQGKLLLPNTTDSHIVVSVDRTSPRQQGSGSLSTDEQSLTWSDVVLEHTLVYKHPSLSALLCCGGSELDWRRCINVDLGPG